MTRPPLAARIRDAAEMLAISERALYRLIDSGQIETIHIGRAVRIPTDALEAFVARLRESA